MELNEYFEIEGIPTLIGIDGTTFKTLNKDLRAEVAEDVKGEKYPWKPVPVSPLDQKVFFLPILWIFFSFFE